MNSNLNQTATKAGLWYILGNILLKGMVFLSLPIFVRILNSADFGIYNAYMAYEGILAAIIGLGLYGSIKNAKFDFSEEFERYISSVFFMSLCSFAVILCVVNLSFPYIQQVVGFSRLVTNCLLFQSMGASFIQLYGAKLNIEFKYKSYLAISIFNSLGSVALSVFLILYVFPNEKYVGRIVGSMLPPAIVFIVVGLFILIKGRVLYSSRYWKYAAKISLPLIPHVVSQSILSQFDRIMIRDMVGDSESGIYSYIYTICTITYVICMSMDNAWTPWVFYQINKDNSEVTIRKAAKSYIEIFAYITIGFVCVMPEIARVLASEEYRNDIDLLIPLALANYFIFMYFLPVGLEYYNKKTKLISLGTLLAAFVNVLLNYICIQKFGFKAAAYTTAVSYLLLFIFHSLIARKYGVFRIYNYKNIVVLSVIVTLILTVIRVTSNMAITNLVIRYLIVIIMLIIVCINRNKYLAVIRRKK